MKDIAKIIKFNGCSKCISNSNNTCKYCVERISKFKVVNSKKIKIKDTELNKHQRADNQKISKISASFRNFYYIDKRDIGFWSQLRYQRFSSIEHLTSYILNSSNVLPSQLAGERYLYFDQKSDELTEYMNRFGNRNYQRIKLKPSLANIQSLFIHQNIIYDQGNVTEARAILLHITKMCYMLGLHRNTTKLSKSAILYKVNLNFQVDNPDMNKVCYGIDWHILPKETAEMIKFNEQERNLIATTIALSSELKARTLFQLLFPSIDSYTNEDIYKLCIDKCSNLRLSYLKCVSGYEILSNKFPEHYELISFDREEFDAYYLHAVQNGELMRQDYGDHIN
ncbi:hypothetical protein CONCODRAFT_4804 [Conidiobolus coronatus NRRL 28638]|uniref:Uncharacterized protein n=1 Tax=Conidiobolus coronatus (strain ATCC 28846 / CBS 209.66 / NRRL 28638) TaxID=796925 RepID=A0A137PBM4_CONC2|nr:hypothetical protein CONCODRAFT_4804 [Conidiobolus coronatus NRRL 28638]|eukprot:KXN72362.1 hypothetical protein CONCODRAFT_4804 [Conidiobolus coronatus NRRL 28638]